MRHFKISEEVQSALDTNSPIVALESTIITHGMPYPQNRNTAKSVENTIRCVGVTPATIAIISGVIHVGLTDSDIDYLSQLDIGNCYKCTRRTLPYVVSNKYNGSTTVAATMYIAHIVGIPIFVTGGVGGVHRGVEQSMDISADLIELSHTPVTVVCAGIKSILDIHKTLEYLETHGVTVTTLNQRNFPAFFMSDSKIKSPLTSNTVSEIASMITISNELKLNNGILVAVPNNFDSNMNNDFSNRIEHATDIALSEVKEKHIRGRDITPYILDRVHTLTKGESLNANIQLIHNNARIGAQIALELYNNNNKSDNRHASSEVLVIGGCVMDIIASPNNSLIRYTSNPGYTQISYGGTGRNISQCISMLEHSVTMVSAVGDDVFGDKIINHCESMGINTSFIMKSRRYPTSSYIAIFDKNNDLFVSVADLSVLENEMNVAYFNSKKIQNVIQNATFIVLDGNVPYEISKMITSQIRCGNNDIKIWFEPISVEKAKRIVDKENGNKILNGITYISPNEMELFALLKEMKYPYVVNENNTTVDEYVKYCKYIIECGVQNVILTMGSNGVLLVDEMKHKYIKVNKLKSQQIENTNGAGDNLCGATICSLLEGNNLIDSVMKYGINASRLSLQSKQAVHPNLSKKLLLQNIRANL